jgi:hypothetical protein
MDVRPPSPGSVAKVEMYVSKNKLITAHKSWPNKKYERI